jgi:hypothetical protein
MRGTWQGSGTWQTGGGPDLAGLIGVVVLVVIAVTVAEFIAAYIWWIVGIGAAVILLAAAGGITYLVHRARQDRSGRPIAGRPVYPVPPAGQPHLEELSKPALEPAREVHLHLNVSPDQLAAIMRHYTQDE